MAPAFMQKLPGPGCERAEEEIFLAVNHPRIKMGNGHRWSRAESLAVDLRRVFFNDLGIPGDHPLTSDWKSPIAFRFGNTGFLEKGQRTTARPDEHKISLDHSLLSALFIAHGHDPSFALFGQIDNAMAEMSFAILLLPEPVAEIFRKCAKVHIRAAIHVGCRDGLILIATFNKQRSPGTNFLPVRGVFHGLEKVMLLQALKASLQIRHLFLGMNERNVWKRLDAFARLLDNAFAHPVGPELKGMFEVFKDRNRFRDIDRAVLLHVRRVGKLADSSMPGACVVPSIRGFLSRAVGHFE